MTDDEIALIKDSWIRFYTLVRDTPGTFYQKLFELEPDVQSLLGEDIEHREGRFLGTVHMIVASLQEILLVRETLATLAYNHAGYKVEDFHFGSVGQALIATLEQWLGDEFTPAVRNAWVAAYRKFGDIVADAALYAYPMSLFEARERFLRAVMRVNLGRRRTDSL